MSSISPLLFVVSGPSGSGKGTLMKHVVERFPEIRRVPTYTTREPRPGEVRDQDYRYVDETTFNAHLDSGEIFECTRSYGSHLYGSPRKLLEVSDPSPLIVEMDYKGMFRIRASSRRHVVPLFVLPPLGKELEGRITGRNKESDLKARLEIGLDQLQFAWAYDYVVENLELDKFMADIEHAVGAELLRARGRQAMLDHRHDYDHTLVG